ncbi:hypothetical protein PtB15_7B203 [Puccinia triticina]|nr:hypothetical protein PtB15_7B203 [Puccinia triticina]
MQFLVLAFLAAMALGPTRVSSYGCPVKANPALWCTTYTPISTQTARASFMDVRIHRPLDPAGHCKNAGPGRSLTRYCCQPSVRPTSNHLQDPLSSITPAALLNACIVEPSSSALPFNTNQQKGGSPTSPDDLGL